MGLFNLEKKKQEKLKAQRDKALQEVKAGNLENLKKYGHDKEIVLEAIQNSKENITSEIALFLQNGDEDVVCALLDRGWGKTWDCYDEKIQNNPQILEKYLKQGGTLNKETIKETINESLFLNHKSLALLSFKIPQIEEELRRRIVEAFNDDFDVALEGVGFSGEYICLLNEKLRNQYGILASAVKTYPDAIFLVDKTWVSDVRVVKNLLKGILGKLQTDRTYLLKRAVEVLAFIGNYAKDPEIIQLKKEITIQMITMQPDSIVFFGNDIQNNPEMLMLFLNQGGNYKNLSLLKKETLNYNPNLALEFVKRGGKDIFEDLDPSLRNNFQIASVAIQLDKSCARFITDKMVLMNLLKQDHSLQQFIEPELFNEVDALLFENEKADFDEEIQKNDLIQEKQKEELEKLKTMVANEQAARERRQELEAQKETIAKQQAEIAALKEMLNSLMNPPEQKDAEKESGKKL